MCLLIAQRIGAGPIPADHLRDGWGVNSDGAGYAFVDDGRLIVHRPFTRLKALLAAYAKDYARCGKSSPFIVHLRFATHGGVSAENTHPFMVADGRVALAHNGVLHDFTSPLKHESDTAFFCRSVLGYRSAGQIMAPPFNKFLADLIGPANKFAMIDHAGTLSIVNESAGHWVGGTWYSNDTYKPRAPLDPAGPFTGFNQRADEWWEIYGPARWDGAEVEHFTDGELFDMGFDCAMGASTDIDRDMLTEEQWHSWRRGFEDGSLALRAAQESDESY